MTSKIDSKPLPTFARVPLIINGGPTGRPTPIPSPIPFPIDQFQTHAGYKAQLRGKSDAELKSEARRLEARIADASSGPSQDKEAVAKAKAELAEVREEQQARAEIAKSKDPKYGNDVHQMSDAQLDQE